MLNRLFIAVGVLVILLIGSAFVVPNFVNWGAFRADLGAFAGEVIGEPVSIAGDVKFTLLPQPRLEFADVTVGAEYQPTLSAQSVVADLSLFDLLRGLYTVTQLKVVRPEAYVHIRSDGQIETGLSAASRPGMQSLSIAVADIEDGRLLVSDDRSGDSMALEALTGLLKLEGLQGPFLFQGSGDIDGARYGLRVSSGRIAADTPIDVGVSLRGNESGFSVTAEGQLTLGDEPRYSGAMLYRQPPLNRTDVGQGDFVMTSHVEANVGKVEFVDFTVIPDENRTTSRLTGKASVTLGGDMSFTAEVNGGLMALPPRDATKETGPAPYELVRTLGELPAPLVPPIPGTLSLKVTQLDMRGTSLRNLVLKAEVADREWSVNSFVGELPGGAQIGLTGKMTADAGRPKFAGQLELTAPRLDLLSTLWRKPAPGNPLFNTPGGVSAEVSLAADRLELSKGQVTIDGEVRPFTAKIGLAGERSLALVTGLGTLDASRSAALLALLPEYAPGSPLLVTFGSGTFDVSVAQAQVGELKVKAATTRGSWDQAGVAVRSLVVSDLGGLGVKFSGKLSGTPEHPVADGTLEVALNDGDAPGLDAAYAALGLRPAVRDAISRLAPARLTFTATPPAEDGIVNVALGGEAGEAKLSGKLLLAHGLGTGLGADDVVTLALSSDAPDSLAERLGLGPLSPLGPDGPAEFTSEFKGDPTGRVATRLALTQDLQSLGFDGVLDFTAPDAPAGEGKVTASFEDGPVLASLAGADGVTVPSFAGSASLSFVAGRNFALNGITGTAGRAGVSGGLIILVADSGPIAMGDLALDSIEASGLWSVLAGPAAQVPGAGIWPEGPIAVGQGSRTTTGRIKVTAKGLTVGGVERFADTSFDLVWDRNSLRLRDFVAHLGEGTLILDASLCCADTSSAKTLTGRVALSGLPIAAVLPEAAQNGVSGTLLDFSAQVTGTGANAAELAEKLTGDGTYSISNLNISGLDPAGFAVIPDLPSLFDREEADVSRDIETALALGPFAGGDVTGSFTIINGTLRAPALAATGTGGRLFGSGSLRLSDLALGGSYELTAEKGVSVPGAQPAVTLHPEGTLLAPSRSLDSSAYVSAISAQAKQDRIEQLETLQAEEDARLKAEAAERTRIEAEQKRLADEAAAKKKADDEARAKAEEAARRQRALELTQPLDLGLGQ